ncbi:type II secretion system protein [Chitinivibrio alkaliphilus]|uniref:Prepilin-type N-terminal cleavage/methylation domain-containing protein n=1 Tax=Chitinivibrio alkaliphilus ACht1 TaxID=1313304 RepID=U7D3Z2_9BACT|nr:prepilin-type N-terminal cleavage/methylation domain-containing protein [Chitinivibrio alkaliphilus]ERP31224.1 hypothetical protein CALK_1840 [Chitinivibrio alkaliphilus ACht1]
MNVKALRSNAGFTLIELLVVIVILGFLVGMLAPRLASIIDDRVLDTVCGSNQRTGVQYIDVFRQQEGRYPSGLINLVVQDGDGVADFADLVWDEDPETVGLFDEELEDHLKPGNWGMNEAEVEELRNLGITMYRMMNQYDGYNFGEGIEEENRRERLARVRLREAESATATVLMAGRARINNGDPITDPLNADNFGWPEGSDISIPEFIGSFIFGLGETSELVTGGYVQSTALCPEAAQLDNVIYGYYSLVLPRLQATSDRLFGDNEVYAKFVAEDDDTRTEIFALHEGLAEWNYAVVCTHGHMLGVEVEEYDFVGAAATREDAEAL